MTEEQMRLEYEREMQMRAEYEREMGGVTPSEPDSGYIEEVHPDVSTADRLLAKNFANSDEATMNFLKTRYPGMDITQRNGRIYLKGRGEKEYRAFDPEGWGQWVDSPMELARDIGDIGYDAVSGTAEAVAAAAAAAAAVPTTGGAGSIPAAMAAGGATGTAAEYLRQKAGQILGLPQEVDPTQVAVSGGIGALGPLAFGTGAAVKGASKAAQASQRGLIERGYDTAAEKIFPKAAEVFSGIPATATKNLADKMNVVDELNQAGVLPHAEAAQDMVVSALNKESQRVGKGLEQAISSAGGKVNISKVKQAFKSHIDEVRKNSPANQETADLLASLQAQYDSIFTFEKPQLKVGADGKMVQTGVRKVEMPDDISATQAFNLQDQLKDSSEFFRVKGGPGQSASQTASRADKKGMNVARGAYSEINNELDRVTSGVSGELKKEYRDLMNMKSKLQPMFKDPETTFRTLTNLSNKSRKPTFEILEQMDKSYGTKVIERAKELEAYKYFGEPSADILSTGGVTSTSRAIPLSVAGGATGGYVGREYGGTPGMVIGSILGGVGGSKVASPAALKALVRTGKFADDKIQRFTPSARKLNAASSAWLGMDGEN